MSGTFDVYSVIVKGQPSVVEVTLLPKTYLDDSTKVPDNVEARFTLAAPKVPLKFAVEAASARFGCSELSYISLTK